MGNERDKAPVEGAHRRPAAQPDAGDPRAMQLLARQRRERSAANKYRRMLSDKLDKFDATVDRACLIFEEAFRQEKHPKDSSTWSTIVIDALTKEIIKAITAEFKVEIAIVQKLSEIGSNAAVKGAKAQKGADDFTVISSILVDTRAFTHLMVQATKDTISIIPDAVAAQEYKKYDAKVNGPEVEKAAEREPTGQDVQQAVQDEMLEAEGLPVTGAAKAEDIAISMMRSVKATMVGLAVSPADREEKLNDAKSDPAKREIPEAEKNLSMDADVYNDKRSRERAEPIVKGNNS